MAAEPTVEPTVEEPVAEGEEALDEGEESDVYEIEGDDEEHGDSFEPDEEEDEEEAEEPSQKPAGPGLTALLLGGQSGPIVEEEEDSEDEYSDYQDDGEPGSSENPIDLSSSVTSSVAGAKRGAEELSDDGDVEEVDEEGESAAKKARV